MDKKIVITIGRQFGSGGRDIGFELAKRLGIKCFDKEILQLAAKDSGLCEDIFELHDEKPTNSFLYSLVMDSYSTGYASPGLIDVPINQKVFLAQFESIKKLAKSQSCIIVGRCADYTLDGELDYTSIFISSDMNTRIERISNRMKIDKNKAKELINKTDKKRSSYYNYYTNKKWGSCCSYDLSLDSSKLGIDESISLIEEYIKLKY